MTFKQAMILTRSVSSATAFSDAECEAYFDLLSQMPEHALIVEVGLQYGRSSSIALQVAKACNLRYHGIDPFTDHADVEKAWLKMALSAGASFLFSKKASNEVVLREPIDLILVDGDHTYQGVADDCKHFLPLIRHGGYALFHDFGHKSLPEVYNAVLDYMDGNPHWCQEAVVDTLGICRRT